MGRGNETRDETRDGTGDMTRTGTGKRTRDVELGIGSGYWVRDRFNQIFMFLFQRSAE